MIRGAVVAGKQVQADIGGNLHIESLQDSSQFDSKQSNSGFSASICVPPFCYGSSSASANTGKSKVDGDYLSVVEQSGIQAGDGGFDVRVQGNTDLTGAVIASSQSAIDNNKNRLETGSLTTRDLANHDSYEAGGYSVSGSVSTQMGDQSEAANPKMTDADKAAADAAANPANHKPGASAGVSSANGSQSSTTRSGISAGTIVITDEAAQQALTGQDAAATLASLNTDVTTGSDAGALAKAWNGQKLQQEVQGQIAITQAFSQVAPKAVADFANSQMQRLMDEAIAAAKAGDTEKANALKNEAGKWGEGQAYRIALHTAVGGLGGGINGAAGAAASASAANLMNDLQDGTQQALEDAGFDKDTAKLMAQGIAALTASGIGAAVGGMQGAATAYTVDVNNRQLHPDQTRAVKKRAEQLSGKDGLTADQWELRLMRQLLKENDSGFSGYAEDAQARAILTDIEDKTGVNMSAKDTAAYTNHALNSGYLTSQEMRDAYNKAGLPPNIARDGRTTNATKALIDAARDWGSLSQQPIEVQASVLRQLVAALGRQPDESQLAALQRGSMSAVDAQRYRQQTQDLGNTTNQLMVDLNRQGSLPEEFQTYFDIQRKVGTLAALSGMAAGAIGAKGATNPSSATTKATTPSTNGKVADTKHMPVGDEPLSSDSLAVGNAARTGSAIDGIYSSTHPLAEGFPELRGVNPHYIDGAGPGVNTNCVSCVNATQARLTGRDPNATADPSNGYSSQNGLLPSAPFGFGSVTNQASVISEMQAAGDGAARPLILLQPGNVQHVINTVNKDGKVYFIDPQLGKIVTLQPNVPVRLGNAP